MKETKIFIGNRPYILRAQKSDTREAYSFIQQIFNSLYSFLSRKESMLFGNLEKDYPLIVAHLFFSILHYNRIRDLPARINLYTVENEAIALAEPVIYLPDKYENSICLAFSLSLIRSFLKSRDHTVRIKFSENIINDENIDDGDTGASSGGIWGNLNPRNRTCEKIFKSSRDDFFRAFILADHLATHFVEERELGKTDWISHSNFGENIKEKFTTLNTLFKVSITTDEYLGKCRSTQNPINTFDTLLQHSMLLDFDG